MSRVWLRLAAAFCLAMALITWATLVPALLDPPQWNRVDRFLAGVGWFYIGYIHWRLANALTAAAAAGGVGGHVQAGGKA